MAMNVQMQCSRAVLLMLTLAVGACGAGENGSGESRGLDLKITEEATAADAGLPAYPGSKPYKDPGETSSSANLGFSTPLFGLKVVGMNLESEDAPDQVASFYRKALSKYGRVVECREGADRNNASDAESESDEVKCEADDPGSHSVVYKAGVEKDQRIVAIKPHGSGTRFSLVHVSVRD